MAGCTCGMDTLKRGTCAPCSGRGFVCGIRGECYYVRIMVHNQPHSEGPAPPVSQVPVPKGQLEGLNGDHGRTSMWLVRQYQRNEDFWSPGTSGRLEQWELIIHTPYFVGLTVTNKARRVGGGGSLVDCGGLWRTVEEDCGGRPERGLGARPISALGSGQ